MKKKIKFVFVLFILVSILFLFFFSPLSRCLNSNEGKTLIIESMKKNIMEYGNLAPVIFILFFIVCIIFFIPAIIPISIGCLLFGKWYGLVYNFIGVISGGTLSFILSRYLVRDFAVELLIKKHFKKFDDKVEQHGFYIILYFCLLLVPFTYLSFAAGLSKIKLRHFAGGTVLGVIPGLIILTFFWDGLKQLFRNYNSPTDLLQWNIIIPSLIFVFFFFLPIIIKKFKKNKFYPSIDIEYD